MFPSQFHDTFLLLFKNNQSPVLTQLKSCRATEVRADVSNSFNPTAGE